MSTPDEKERPMRHTEDVPEGDPIEVPQVEPEEVPEEVEVPA